MNPEPEGCGTKKMAVDLHYEEQWGRYSEEDVIARAKNLSSVLDAVISHMKEGPPSRILDLGCGPAILPLRACDSLGVVGDIQIYGIDISNQALQLGKKVIKSKGLDSKVHLIVGDCEKLPFQNISFDAVISNATINLLPDKEKGFGEIARVTEKGGSVVIGDCTTRSSKQCCSEDDDRLWSACISGAPTKTEFLKLAQEAGLKMLNMIELTEEVTHLVKKDLWDWPEFLQYEMDYQVFVMRKG